MATQGFADLGLVTPDFIVPAQFLFTNGGTVNFAGVSFIAYTSLPTDGSHSLNASNVVITNSPTNFAGSTGSITPSANNAPTLANPIADRSTAEDAAFSFIVPGNTFADTDAGDALTYAATKTDGSALPGWLSFIAGARTFSGTPANGDVGVVNVRVTARDTANATASDDFVLTITNVNDAPSLANLIADRSTAEDAAFSFVVPGNTFADVDAGDILIYTVTKADGSALPSWLSFNAGTRTFSGTPANGDVGVVNVRVTATDSGNASLSEDYALTVANVNDSPTLANPIADRSTAEDAAFSFVVPANTFADIDAGDTLNYSATRADGSALPAWLSFNAGTRTFSGTPANGDVGILNLRVTATDSGSANLSGNFALTVTNVNDAPIAGSYGNQSAGLGQAVALNLGLLFSDVDAGDTLSFGASGLPAGISINATTGQITGTAPNATGVHHITVTATDSGNASAGLNFDLVVTTGNTVTANVLTRGDIALPGVTVHELASATPAGSLYSFKNLAVDSNAGTGLKTLTADLISTGSGTAQIGLTLLGVGGATFQGFQLTGPVSAAGGWSITESNPASGYTLVATHASSSIAADTLIGKVTLTLPASATGASILDLTDASLGTQSAPSRGLAYSFFELGGLGQLNAALPDSNLALSFSRGTADYLINGVTKPITAADALDALKLSVGLVASRGSSWKELISADMNHDGRVTAADALEILKISVGLNTIQPSWVFVPNDAGTNPNLAAMTRTTVTYKDDLNLASITAPTSATITGILVGDVNNSWVIPA